MAANDTQSQIDALIEDIMVRVEKYQYDNGYTNQQMAEKIDISYSSLARIKLLHRVGIQKISMLVTVCKGIDIKLSDVLEEHGL